MSEFTWNITNTTSENEENDSIVHVEWRCTCVDGDMTKSIYGGVNLNPTQGSFIPYDDVRESEVLGWLFAPSRVDGIPLLDKQSTEDFLIGEITIRRSLSQGTPW